MIAYTDALQIIQRAANAPVTGTVKTSDALHKVLAEDFIAPLALPRFDNSSMDGFALRANDTLSASTDTPLTLTVLRAQAAGDAATCNQPGHAVEIMTGAAMPSHADAVIPIEHVTTHCDAQGNVTQITLTHPVPQHNNVRFAGEDFVKGQPLIMAGTRVTPAHIGILYGTGTTQLKVVTPPNISIFTTGKEVSDDYEAPLGPSQIYNSNTPYLIAEFQTIGIPAVCAGHIGDDEERFRTLLSEHKNTQILVSSGAVSKGKWEILFHRVAIKPGKPILFARFKDGRYFFGLPGNPISAAIGLRFFMMPLIRRLLGLTDEIPVFAKLADTYCKKGPLRLFLKAESWQTPDGSVSIRLLPGQESFKIAPLLQTNSWAVLDETTTDYDAGQPIMCYPVQLLA
jgi:molybdopterin molybdotransferase